MFAAVRAKLIGAWSSLREGSLAKLFVFEFVVVLLGVLAAQWVADWAGNRSLEREADAAFVDAVAAATKTSRVHAYWFSRADCVIDRAQMVARAASDGRTLTQAEIGRPALPTTNMPSWNEDVRQAALRSRGADTLGALVVFENQSEAIRVTNAEIRNQWATFALLDQANGEPDEADFAAARYAAVRAADYLRFYKILYSSSSDARAQLGVGEVEVDPSWSEVVDECGMIKGWGE